MKQKFRKHTGIIFLGILSLLMTNGAYALKKTTVYNNTQFSLRVAWKAGGCAGVYHGMTLTCKGKTLKPGEHVTYHWKFLQSSKKIKYKLAHKGDWRAFPVKCSKKVHGKRKYGPFIEVIYKAKEKIRIPGGHYKKKCPHHETGGQIL